MSNKKYYVLERRDMARPFKLALYNAGYRKTMDPEEADFLLYDLEQNVYRSILDYFALHRKPLFVYPHSANSWYFWDGFHKEYPVSCCFVFTREVRTAMIAYGYKSRIEPIGFSCGEVINWKGMREKTLLFAPMHTMGPVGQDYLRPPASFRLNREALEKVFELAPLFKKITIRYGKTFIASGMYDPQIRNVVFEQASLKVKDSLASINRHNMVISAGTLAYLAVARGKPTIFYGTHGQPPQEGEMTVRHYDKYKWMDYPVFLDNMSEDMIMKFAVQNDPNVERWKKANIGNTFSANRFISVVREYVKND
jgi:hypothetical protein